jgi:hypothetical protein
VGTLPFSSTFAGFVRICLGDSELHLAFRFPRATIYSVTATPNLDFFVVVVRHKREALKFMPPPHEEPPSNIHEVMGERTPERILAALGIPREWFQL